MCRSWYLLVLSFGHRASVEQICHAKIIYQGIDRSYGVHTVRQEPLFSNFGASRGLVQYSEGKTSQDWVYSTRVSWAWNMPVSRPALAASQDMHVGVSSALDVSFPCWQGYECWFSVGFCLACAMIWAPVVAPACWGVKRIFLAAALCSTQRSKDRCIGIRLGGSGYRVDGAGLMTCGFENGVFFKMSSCFEGNAPSKGYIVGFDPC